MSQGLFPGLTGLQVTCWVPSTLPMGTGQEGEGCAQAPGTASCVAGIPGRTALTVQEALRVAATSSPGVPSNLTSLDMRAAGARGWERGSGTEGP